MISCMVQEKDNVLTRSIVPYPANTKRRFLICIAAPSRRGTGAAAIFSHFNSGAGKSAKVAERTLPKTVAFL